MLTSFPFSACLVDPLVLREIERLQLPEGCEVVAEPWPYGTDELKVDARLMQVWMFMNVIPDKGETLHGGRNFYGHPLGTRPYLSLVARTSAHFCYRPRFLGSLRHCVHESHSDRSDADWH